MSQQQAVKLAEQVIAPEAEPYEPWLPVEQKLVTWSLVLGVAILLVLIVVSYAFFPGAH